MLMGWVVWRQKSLKMYDVTKLYFPNCIFPKCVFQTVFYQTVLFQTVSLQSVLVYISSQHLYFVCMFVNKQTNNGNNDILKLSGTFHLNVAAAIDILIPICAKSIFPFSFCMFPCTEIQSDKARAIQCRI